MRDPPDEAVRTIYFVNHDSQSANLHSFPTRRSSDLEVPASLVVSAIGYSTSPIPDVPFDGGKLVNEGGKIGDGLIEDRKSTRLNSSHVSTSYAVFCLKKKNALSISKTTIPPPPYST